VTRAAVSFGLLLAVLAAAPATGGEPVPRTVIAVWDSAEERTPRASRIHTRAEMPLNHLGLVLRYVDLQEPLPDVAADPSVRGVLSWLSSEQTPPGYARWLESVLDAGKRLVVLGALGVANAPQQSERRRRILERIGVEDTDQFVGVTYDVDITHRNPQVVEFERRYVAPLPSFDVTRARPGARAHLSVARRRDRLTADLVVTSPRGGYAAGAWVRYADHRPDWFKWYLNPFAFFRLAFATDELPKPDVSTLSGRRIYYSHIDGDGWRNVSRVDGYREQGALSAEVILREIIAPYPDLPVTVAPVVGDLHPRWHGSEQARRIARAIFALPQVEAASHTMSHPFYWDFFRDYSPDKERPFLPRYQQLNGVETSELTGYGGVSGVDTGSVFEQGLSAYYVPRSFGKHPFSLDEEIDGAAEYLEDLLPAGKDVTLLQWSGDTNPFPEAVEKAYAAGLRNLNGGDSRLDQEFDSHAWVAPVARRVGAHWQIYASNSNENTYTDLWTKRFFGQRYLIETLERTESPVRLRPINVYYHMYSGERVASLGALRLLLDYVREQQVAPVWASRYAAIAEGFLGARITRLGDRHWRIEDHGALATIRFDHAAGQTVDLARSHAVVGMREHQGSLYVAIDERAGAAEIALRDAGAAPAGHGAPPYLVESRWRVFDLRRDPGAVTFSARGFGPGEMTWRVPPGAGWKALPADAGTRVTQRSRDGERLRLRVETGPAGTARVRLARGAGAP